MEHAKYIETANRYLVETINERASDVEFNESTTDIINKIVQYVEENEGWIKYDLTHPTHRVENSDVQSVTIPFSKFVSGDSPLFATKLKLSQYVPGSTTEYDIKVGGTYSPSEDVITIYFPSDGRLNDISRARYENTIAHEIAHAVSNKISNGKSIDSALAYLNNDRVKLSSADKYNRSTEELNAFLRGSLKQLNPTHEEFLTGAFKNFDAFKDAMFRIYTKDNWDERLEINKNRLTKRLYTYWDEMRNKNAVTETADKKYADAHAVSLINGLLGGSKNVQNAVNQYGDFSDIPVHVGLMANLENAKRNYKALFDDKGRIRNKFDSSEILKRKTAVDDAELALINHKD